MAAPAWGTWKPTISAINKLRSQKSEVGGQRPAAVKQPVIASLRLALKAAPLALSGALPQAGMTAAPLALNGGKVRSSARRFCVSLKYGERRGSSHLRTGRRR